MIRRPLIAAFLVCATLVAPAANRAPARTAKPAKIAAPAQSAYIREPYVGAASAALPSGHVIFSDGGDRPARPASVTKLMTAYLILEDVKAGKYKLTDPVTATADVNKSEPSWVGLKAGDTMTVSDMLTALMVESANDVAIALAVHSSGSLAGFVARMNGEAAKLGMTGTKYHNPNGLPPKPKYPWKEHNVSTATDQLKLSVAMMKNHPEILQFTSVKTCDLVRTATGYYVWVTRRVNENEKPSVLTDGRGKKIAQIAQRKKVKITVGYDCVVSGKSLYLAKNEQEAFDWCFKGGYEVYIKQMRNHNNVMVKDKMKVFDAAGKEVVDGLKTGYIDAGGSSVVLTGQKGGKRVVVVVLGSKGSKLRDEKARGLLTDALGAVVW